MYHEVALPDGRRGYVIYTAGSFQRREVTQLGVITAHKRPFMTGKHQIREASAYAACGGVSGRPFLAAALYRRRVDSETP